MLRFFAARKQDFPDGDSLRYGLWIYRKLSLQWIRNRVERAYDTEDYP